MNEREKLIAKRGEEIAELADRQLDRVLAHFFAINASRRTKP